MKRSTKKDSWFSQKYLYFFRNLKGEGLWAVIHRRHQNGQVRKDERMGLAKTPPGDGERTHLRFAFLSQAKYHFKMSEIVAYLEGDIIDGSGELAEDGGRLAQDGGKLAPDGGRLAQEGGKVLALV